ncbi:hypothetical protein B7494_g6321 [Chlorociboria aeruginascens]|nr:hypothetical protein B7494_g6321 [Chlorociboria aeruginascens]
MSSLITTSTEELRRNLAIVLELTESWDPKYLEKLMEMVRADAHPTGIIELRKAIEKVKDWPSICIYEYFEDALEYRNLSLLGQSIRDYAAELNAMDPNKNFILQQEPEFLGFLQRGAEMHGKKWELRNHDYGPQERIHATDDRFINSYPGKSRDLFPNAFTNGFSPAVAAARRAAESQIQEGDQQNGFNQ